MMSYQHHVEIEAIDKDENENEKKSAGGGGVVMVEREHMFDKVVTPSDVGKLNRLVIPKQHAEKYFPLDSSNNEKGLLLNFEDGTGKPWRFRYSYWNSSQSYVMTKGWSRFVKEKKLDAGDIVSFQRGVGVGVGEFGKDKLFIDWRRRPDHNHHHIGSSYNLPHHAHAHAHAFLPHQHNQFYHHSVSHGRAPTPPPPPTFVLRSHPYPHPNSYPYPQQQQPGLIRRPGGGGVGSGYYGYGSVVNPYPVTGSLIFLRSTSSSGGMTTTTGMMNTTTHKVEEEEEEEETQNVYESVPVVQGKAAAKRLRLFGVNMECTTPISHQTHDFDILSSALASSSSSINHHHHHHTSTEISMGPPSTTPTSSTSLPLQLRSFFNGTSSSSSSAKGKSSNTSSSSMSLDLDI